MKTFARAENRERSNAFSATDIVISDENGLVGAENRERSNAFSATDKNDLNRNHYKNDLNQNYYKYKPGLV